MRSKLNEGAIRREALVVEIANRFPDGDIGDIRSAVKGGVSEVENRFGSVPDREAVAWEAGGKILFGPSIEPYQRRGGIFWVYGAARLGIIDAAMKMNRPEVYEYYGMGV